MGSCWPEDVGILAIEIVFPSQYVDQSDLEVFNHVSPGKYVKGLGQAKMGFCTDREDIHSLCLTVVHNLMERYNIQFSQIGHLEVGTETLLDKSKSVKTVLMQLFEPHGVTDIEGIDTTNACYGGTAALFNAISWIESSSWDGRYALVVAADIAVYAQGPARPTGGAGAVAILIGPNAPLVFDRGVRASYMKHSYDFYKPQLDSEYPVVDGMLSIKCYLSALDHCYQGYLKKSAKRTGNSCADVEYFDYFAFHSPYCKLVQKSFARLVFNDFINNPDADKFKGLERFKGIKLADSYFDKDVEKAFSDVSKASFDKRAVPSLLVANQVGNTYTSSVYGGLASLLVNVNIKDLAGARIGLFSYGSGLASSMFSLTVTKECGEGSSLRKLLSKISNVKELLNDRIKVSPEKFSEILEMKEKKYGKPNYEPVCGIESLFPGTYYLTKVDEMHRRFYKRLTKAQNGTS